MPANVTGLLNRYTTPFEALPREVQLRRLIEVHTRLERAYGRVYRAVRDIHKQCRELKDEPTGPFSKKDIVAAATEIRDFVARYYTWAIQAVELNANEIAPGTYPNTDMTTRSEDPDDFDKALKAWLELLERMAEWEDLHGGLDGFTDKYGNAAGGVRSSYSDMGTVGF